MYAEAVTQGAQGSEREGTHVRIGFCARQGGGERAEGGAAPSSYPARSGAGIRRMRIGSGHYFASSFSPSRISFSVGASSPAVRKAAAMAAVAWGAP